VLILRQGRLALDQPLHSLRQSNTLRIRTDAAVDSLPELLGRMPQVEEVQQLDEEEDRRLFLLKLRTTADREVAASNIATCVINAGGRLYQLELETRDLESVFREVSIHGG
jgi:ABC-2 type transport system ATP-binding protein